MKVECIQLILLRIVRILLLAVAEQTWVYIVAGVKIKWSKVNLELYLIILPP